MTELINERVRYDVDGAVARITLARPDAGNGLDLAMAQAIQAAAKKVQRAAGDGGVRAVLLAAEGRMFCVGGDLREIAGASDPGKHIADIAAATHDALRRFANAPVPVVSAVGGAAAGGGIGVALAGDIVLVADNVSFTLAYTAAALSPDCGTSWQLARRLGAARTLDLALTNRLLSAADAAAWGLVSRVVSADSLTTEADKVLLTLGSGPSEAYAETKRLVLAALDSDLVTQLDDEAATISALVAKPDGKEGMDAFLNKRKPVFAR